MWSHPIPSFLVWPFSKRGKADAICNMMAGQNITSVSLNLHKSIISTSAGGCVFFFASISFFCWNFSSFSLFLASFFSCASVLGGPEQDNTWQIRVNSRQPLQQSKLNSNIQQSLTISCGSTRLDSRAAVWSRKRLYCNWNHLLAKSYFA